MNSIPDGLVSRSKKRRDISRVPDLIYIPGVGTLVPDNWTQNDTVNSVISGISVSKSISIGPVSSFPLISKVSETSTKIKKTGQLNF